MTAPPSLGSMLRWISHQRAMSCRTRLRVDCDLGTLPVNVRTSRAPSLSMIRQCRKAKSKGSSFFSEKSTLKVDLGLVSVILPPHCVRPRGQSITRTGVPSVLGQAKGHADAECCPPSDPTAGNLDLPRHPRCDRSPIRGFLSPSARLTVLLPHNSWSTDSLANSRSVELVGDELSIPGQQRIRLRDSRQFFQGFPSEPLSDLSQRTFFGIG